MNLARDGAPALTAEIISLLGDCPENTALKYLATFTRYTNKSIKLRAIHTIGNFECERADRILLSFLSDEEEEIRISAAQNFHFKTTEGVLSSLENIIKQKEFNKKSREEKQALFEFVGKTQSQKGFSILQDILKKIGFLSFRKKVETGLCAVSALELMNTAESAELLKKGYRSTKKSIRLACQAALSRLEQKAGTINIQGKT
jgi:HEAT repeat protein